jgi:laminin, beta 1
LGQAPYCDPCGECFDNWDDILKSLVSQTDDIIERAKLIKSQGATGAYTKEFEKVEKNIDEIRTILQNTTVSMKDIQKINDNIEKLRTKLDNSEKSLKETDGNLDKLHEELSLAQVELINLGELSQKIKNMATELKENATQLQEANVEGALNLTRDAWSKVQSLSNIYREATELNIESDRQCKRIETLISRQIGKEEELLKNDKKIDELQDSLDELISQIPDLNEQVCDKRGDPCDSLCGGAGCGKCGGLSCEKGAFVRAERALDFARNAETIIKEKEIQADDIIRSVSHAKTEALDAHKKAKETFEKVQLNHNSTENLIETSRELIKNLTNTVSNNTASPNEINILAKEILDLDLELDPNEIRLLADNIGSTVSKLDNVDNIIQNTKEDLANVEKLRQDATDAE